MVRSIYVLTLCLKGYCFFWDSMDWKVLFDKIKGIIPASLIFKHEGHILYVLTL